MSKYAKCSVCKHFFLPGYCATIPCATCLYIAVRCKECGGTPGAERSIIAHTHWYRSRGVKRGLGNQHDEISKRAAARRRAA